MVEFTKEINAYLKKLFPITRSITGNGNRDTLNILKDIIPIRILEYPSGESVYDWVIPKEWNIKDAWIKNSSGEKIVNFKRSNIHIVSYSIPVHKIVRGSELKKNLHYLEDIPDAIPYRTSYYNEDWGFCISYRHFKKYFNDDEEYEVFIDSDLQEGSLSIGEILIKGKSSKEYLISTYICHPSLANDNLSGVVLTAFLARELIKKDLNFSYRVLFVPETIGAIAYCANNEDKMKTIECGFVITCVGGPGRLGYKQSYDQGCYINGVVEEVFREKEVDFITYPFDIHGSDERQYSSPFFRINTVTICKDKYYKYDYYHTSFDNLDFISAENINMTLGIYLKAIEKIDNRIIFENKYPYGEIMLSKHGLCSGIGGKNVYRRHDEILNETSIILWLLFHCDGKTDLYEISQRLGISVESLYQMAMALQEKGILQKEI